VEQPSDLNRRERARTASNCTAATWAKCVSAGRSICRTKRTELQRSASGWHIHPGEEVGFIVAGTVEMMIRDQATLTLRPGDGFLIPPRTTHNALDVGPETGQMLSTYIVEVGQPLATFVS
jgi:mannose-6-phosphate isomerase-like protein (cupin superfamily)